MTFAEPLQCKDLPIIALLHLGLRETQLNTSTMSVRGNIFVTLLVSTHITLKATCHGCALSVKHTAAHLWSTVTCWKMSQLNQTRV